MAEQVSLFGIGVGAMLLLAGLVLGGFVLSGATIARARPQAQDSRATMLSRT